MTIPKTLHLHGRDWPGYLFSRKTPTERHINTDGKLCGEHFDEIIIHHTEGFDAMRLSEWIFTTGTTRLRHGGSILVVQGPVYEWSATAAPALKVCECGSGSNVRSGAHSPWCQLWVVS